MEETKCVPKEDVSIEAGFVRNVRNAEGWKTLRLTVQEMQALDLYMRNRQFFIAAQISKDVKSLAKEHRLGANERASLMRAMFVTRCEPVSLLVEHMLTQKAARFHERGEIHG